MDFKAKYSLFFFLAMEKYVRLDSPKSIYNVLPFTNTRVMCLYVTVNSIIYLQVKIYRNRNFFLYKVSYTNYLFLTKSIGTFT